MQLYGPGIVVDYAEDTGWSVEDQTTGIVAYTTDPSAIYGLVQAFGAAQDEEPTGTRDSGDEDPHA